MVSRMKLYGFILLWMLRFSACQEPNASSPNVCQVQETFPKVTMVANGTKLVQEAKQTWCLAIPPRCTTYRTVKRVIYTTETRMIARLVNKCCDGYIRHVNGTCVLCPAGTWGAQCQKQCECRSNATCDTLHGHCQCRDGWKGVMCEQPCPQGQFGRMCLQACRCGTGIGCDAVTGACRCVDGFCEADIVHRLGNPVAVTPPTAEPKRSAVTVDSEYTVTPHNLIVVTPTPKPENPASVAQSSNTRSEQSTVTPKSLVAQPEYETVTLERYVTGKPESHTYDPENLTIVPEYATTQSEQSTTTPEIPTVQPDYVTVTLEHSATAKPKSPTDELENPTTVPEYSTTRSEQSTITPKNFTSQPKYETVTLERSATGKPESHINEPENPTTVRSVPENSTTRSEQSTITTKNITAQPVTLERYTTAKPESPTDEPENPSIVPKSSTASPSFSTVGPEQPTAKTEKRTRKSENPTVKFEYSTVNPENPESPKNPTVQSDNLTVKPKYSTGRPFVACNHCRNGGFCEPGMDKCSCPAGRTGELCADDCETGFYGKNCKKTCQTCYNAGTCDRITGACKCMPGYTGRHCEKQCNPGQFGVNCRYTCNCSHSYSCDPVSGRCGCNLGFTGDRCDHRECPDGMFGTPSCNSTCRCGSHTVCHPYDGACTCQPNWEQLGGPACSICCILQDRGPECHKKCANTDKWVCALEFDGCVCLPGFVGPECVAPAANDPAGTLFEWNDQSGPMVGIGVAISVCVAVIVTLLIICCRRRSRKSRAEYLTVAFTNTDSPYSDSSDIDATRIPRTDNVVYFGTPRLGQKPLPNIPVTGLFVNLPEKRGSTTTEHNPIYHSVHYDETARHQYERIEGDYDGSVYNAGNTAAFDNSLYHQHSRERPPSYDVAVRNREERCLLDLD